MNNHNFPFFFKKTGIALIVTFCLHSITYGQSNFQIKSKVVDKSGESIPYSHIAIINSNTGTISDENGFFELDCTKNDSVRITAVGFASTTYLCGNISNSVILKNNIYSLEELVVSAKGTKATKTIKIGNQKSKRIGQYQGVFEGALYIPNQKKIRGNITQLIFNLSKQRFSIEENTKNGLLPNYELVVQARVYNVSYQGRPNNDILNTALIYKMKKRQRKLTFDIKDYNIEFPKEGVFISLEFLGLIKNNIFHSIESLSKQDKYQFAILNSGKHTIPNSFMKWALTSDWEKLDDLENGAYDNLNFGIEVEY